MVFDFNCITNKLYKPLKSIFHWLIKNHTLLELFNETSINAKKIYILSYTHY